MYKRQTFANTGVYTYDKLRVVSQPVQGIEEKTVKLGEEALENVDVYKRQVVRPDAQCSANLLYRKLWT